MPDKPGAPRALPLRGLGAPGATVSGLGARGERPATGSGSPGAGSGGPGGPRREQEGTTWEARGPRSPRSSSFARAASSDHSDGTAPRDRPPLRIFDAFGLRRPSPGPGTVNKTAQDENLLLGKLSRGPGAPY